MKLQEFQIQFLAALDDLRRAEICEGAMSSPTLVENVRGLRLLCENAAQRYMTALEELGFGAALRGPSNDPVAYYNRDTERATRSLAPGHGNATSSSSSGNPPYHTLESVIVMPALADGEHPMTNEDWHRETKKLEKLMILLHPSEAENPLLLSRLRADEDNLYASLLHQRTQAESEFSALLSGYKDSLERAATLLIELDALYAQIDKINIATDLDLEATAVVRVHIAQRSQSLAGNSSRCIQ